MQNSSDTKHQPLKPYVSVIEYPHERQEITEAFSAACDVRDNLGRGRNHPPRAAGGASAPCVRSHLRRPLVVRGAGRGRHAGDALRMSFRRLRRAFTTTPICTTRTPAPRPACAAGRGKRGALEAAKARFWNAVHREAAARYPLDPRCGGGQAHGALPRGGAVGRRAAGADGGQPPDADSSGNAMPRISWRFTARAAAFWSTTLADAFRTAAGSRRPKTRRLPALE